MPKASKSFDFKSLLHNTFVLYFILFISVAYLFFFMQTGNFRSVFVFLLVGFLTTFYSKNMIVVLVCALIGTRIISTMDNLHEGLENKEGAKTKKGKKGKEGNKNIKDESTDEESDEEITQDNEEDEFGGMSNSEIKEVISNRKDIQEDLQNILKTQEEMINGVTKLEPLINKAESFYEKYKNFEGMGKKIRQSRK